jgi:hypothetical protein
MNIREGDFLVIGSNEYPIRSVGEWSSLRLTSTKAFQKQATVSASTKRSPAIASGKRGTPATLLTGLSCTPLDPVDPEISRRLGLDTPHELLQTFLADSTGFVVLIVEELKR